jgi:anti-anti-sigma regulatory factor
LSIEVRHDESSTRLTVIGHADLTTASELKTALLEALSAPSKCVEIDLTQATALNLTCFQLIWAANAEAAALGASLTILEPVEPAVLEYLQEAGLRLPTGVTVEATKEVCA